LNGVIIIKAHRMDRSIIRISNVIFMVKWVTKHKSYVLTSVCNRCIINVA